MYVIKPAIVTHSKPFQTLSENKKQQLGGSVSCWFKNHRSVCVCLTHSKPFQTLSGEKEKEKTWVVLLVCVFL